ncbi:TetR/AcrR family transcriptional regulator [Nocardia sp. NPDC059180]|uniref:TetR/AcrR family transcriptional regulator n=1 Tax=Nocardia sp. NPDC059180 TaxID=3346761 RepID=UPI00369DDD18
MVAVTRTPKASWIEQGLRALASGGPDAVRVEALAQSLGVTKGGFYGHFADRNALLREMLDTWEHECTFDVRERVEREGGDARAKARRAGVLTFSDDRLRPIDLAVRDWARRDDEVAERLRRVDNYRIGYLRELLGTFCTDPDEIEARSLMAFCLAVGKYVIAAEHEGRTRDEVVARASAILLQQPPGDTGATATG